VVAIDFDFEMQFFPSKPQWKWKDIFFSGLCQPMRPPTTWHLDRKEQCVRLNTTPRHTLSSHDNRQTATQTTRQHWQWSH